MAGSNDPELDKLLKEAAELEAIQKEAEELERLAAGPAKPVPVKVIKPSGPSQADLGDDIELTPTAPYAAGPSAPGYAETALMGAAQGATFNFSDELEGVVGVAGELADRGLEKIGLSDGPVGKMTGEKLTRPQLLEVYRQYRDRARAENDLAAKTNPKTFIAGAIAGGAATGPASAAKGGLKTLVIEGAKLGAKQGAVGGLGASNSDLTDLTLDSFLGAAKDTAVGTLAGGAVGAVAPVVVKGVTATGKALKDGGKKLIEKGMARVEDAKERALATATKEEMANLASLKGELGGETQKGSRLTENLRRIPGDADPRRPVETEIELLKKAKEAAQEKMDEALAKFRSKGLTEEEIFKIGEFRPKKGSSLAEAQRAVDEYAEAKAALEGFDDRISELTEGLTSGKLKPGELVLPPGALDPAEAKALRDAALRDPEFAALEQRVMQRNIEDFPEQASRIQARREAFKMAADTVDDKIDDRAKELLSGAAAKKRAMELGMRYGLPLLGSYVGTEWIGGPEGAVVGAGLGLAAGGGAERAVGALAGAGLRPGFQALYRTATQYPAFLRLGGEAMQSVGRGLDTAPVRATLNKAAQAMTAAAPAIPAAARSAQRAVQQKFMPTGADKIKTVLNTNPAALGPYGAMLKQRLDQGEGQFLTTHYLLSQSDPAYQKLMKDIQK